MTHPHRGLVQQAMLVEAVALGTLAARTAIVLNSDFNAITATFLMKRIRYLLQLVGRTANDDQIIIGLAKGNASIAEIASAMIENNTAGPDDVTQSLTEDTSFVVYQNTVSVLLPNGGGAEAAPKLGWSAVGGRKGIPAQEGSGFQLFAFNAGAGALATGSSINGIAHVQGVWLRD